MSAYKKMMGGDITLAVEKVFLTDYETAWQSVLAALKATQLDITNRDAGLLQTRWIDNTVVRNFSDSYAGSLAYAKAQYRLKIYVSKGVFNSRHSVKISITKEQYVQRDVIDDWHALESDHIEENTLLYRVGRLVYMSMEMAEIQEARVQKEIEASTNPSPSPSLSEP